METPKTFEQFWLRLIEHEIWYDQMKMRFHRKDLKGIANDCYIFLLASQQRWENQDYQDFRKCYQAFLSKAPDQIARPQLQQTATEEQTTHNMPIVTGEERDKYIQQWLESVKSVEQKAGLVPKLTYKQMADEGDWLPPKEKPYPSTNIDYLIQSEIHIQYCLNNYDAVTGKPNINWKNEDEWIRDNQKEINEWLNNLNKKL